MNRFQKQGRQLDKILNFLATLQLPVFVQIVPLTELYRLPEVSVSPKYSVHCLIYYLSHSEFCESLSAFQRQKECFHFDHSLWFKKEEDGSSQFYYGIGRFKGVISYIITSFKWSRISPGELPYKHQISKCVFLMGS